MARGWPDWEWDVIEPASEEPHLQLALDEVLLGSITAGRRRPTLRFWDWSTPALVLGSHQSVRNEVDQREAARFRFTICRRMSGGGTMLVEPGRTITYSLYAPAQLVAGMSFVDSFAFLDGWVVDALQDLGVEAAHRPINDIVSPCGKIGGAPQARRREAVLHHTAMAHAMDTEALPRLIRIGRRRLARHGLRSAEKEVSPLDTLLALDRDAVVRSLLAAFRRQHRTGPGCITPEEDAHARELARAKYAQDSWIRRLP